MASSSAPISAGPRPTYGEGREALLRAAIHVVANGGLRQLTYRAVAAEAGVTHGLVAHHFGSRDALVVEALKFSTATSIEASSLLADSGSVDDYVEGLVDMVTSNPDTQVFQYELLLEARRRPELREHAVQLHTTYRAAARQGLKRLGISDERFADLVYACLDGLVFEQVTVTTESDTRELIAELRRILQAQISRST